MADTTVHADRGSPPPLPDSDGGPKVTLLILRVVVVLTSVLIIVQPFLAGAYLQGEFDALGLHELNANVITGLALIQVIVAVVYWRVGRGVAAPVLASLALLVLVVVQGGMGYSRLLAVHIPLGVAVVGFAVVMIVRVFDKRATTGRGSRAVRTSGSANNPNAAGTDPTT